MTIPGHVYESYYKLEPLGSCLESARDKALYGAASAIFYTYRGHALRSLAVHHLAISFLGSGITLLAGGYLALRSIAWVAGYGVYDMPEPLLSCSLLHTNYPTVAFLGGWAITAFAVAEATLPALTVSFMWAVGGAAMWSCKNIFQVNERAHFQSNTRFSPSQYRALS